MSFVEKHRYGSGHTEQDLLRTSWEGEIFGTGMLEELAKRYPEYADPATAGATMEWYNVHRCEDFGHETGVAVTLEKAEKLGREGAELVRKHSFKTVAQMTAAETPASDKMYNELAKITKNPELKPSRATWLTMRTRCATGSSPRSTESPTVAQRFSPISSVTTSQERTRLPLERTEKTSAGTSSSWFSRSSTPRTPPTRQPRR